MSQPDQKRQQSPLNVSWHSCSRTIHLHPLSCPTAADSMWRWASRRSHEPGVSQPLLTAAGPLQPSCASTNTACIFPGAFLHLSKSLSPISLIPKHRRCILLTKKAKLFWVCTILFPQMPSVLHTQILQDCIFCITLRSLPAKNISLISNRYTHR